MLIDNNTSISDAFSICVATTVALAKVDDFKDGEIRRLSPKNPTAISKVHEWDGILNNDNGQPIQGDYGINAERKIFVYWGNRWRSIKEMVENN